LLLKIVNLSDEIYSTEEILEEFSEVLKRDFLYNELEIKNIITNVLAFVNLVYPGTQINIIKEDVDDNKILECAIESNSEYILSYDKHLLKLQEFQGIKILTPEDFVKLLEVKNIE
jgi:hypothetical protein